MIIRNRVLVCIIGLLLIPDSCSFLKNVDPVFILKQKNHLDSVFTPSPKLPYYFNFDCITSPESPEIGYITHIIDGDSIKALIDGKEYEIRYIGINTPEYYSDEKAAAERATQENRALVNGKKVYLFKDTSNTDKFNRLLRYVFTDEYFVNYELVKRGFAESKSYLPDTSCQAFFNKAIQ